MRRKRSSWVVTAVVCTAWLGVNLGLQGRVEARQVGTWRSPSYQNQACTTGPDLRIRSITVEPDPPGVGQSYNVYVEITNYGTESGTAGSWTFLYVDRAPPPVPPYPPASPDVQAYAPTEGLAAGQSVFGRFTVTETHASAGWHTVSAIIDSLDNVNESACSGETNNTGAISFQILQVYTPSPTPTNPPSPTAFTPPTIYSFTPESEIVVRGQPVTLRWQVYGQSVSVYLDGELVPLEDSRVIYPTETHIYTLRAQNPGGYVQARSTITVVGPTSTPTLTPTVCPLATINEFAAAPSAIVRGATTTVFWDVSRADKVFLNGEPVPAVSERTVQLNQTTVYTLVGRNGCGDTERTLTVQVSYATPSPTWTITITPTPTRTSTPTYTPQPTDTPTRRVLSTPTGTSVVGSGTATLTPEATRTLAPFESPLESPTVLATSTATETPTPEATPTLTPTAALTATATLAATDTPSATVTVLPATPTAEASATAQPTILPTVTPAAASPTAPAVTSPTPPPTPKPATGGLRMYLCPLGILIAFAVGVLVVAVVWPRIQDHQVEEEPYSPDLSDALLDPDEPLVGEDPLSESAPLWPDTGGSSPSSAGETDIP